MVWSLNKNSSFTDGRGFNRFNTAPLGDYQLTQPHCEMTVSHLPHRCLALREQEDEEQEDEEQEDEEQEEKEEQEEEQEKQEKQEKQEEQEEQE